MGGDKREGRGRERTIIPMAMVFLHNSMRGKEVMELLLDPRGRCGDYRRGGQGSSREFLERHEYDESATAFRQIPQGHHNTHLQFDMGTPQEMELRHNIRLLQALSTVVKAS